jgi:membrane protein YqaA with SNARE-associated domain
MSFLHNIAQWLVNTLEPYGAPGLMLIAICDSSFLSLPEVNDAALMALSINDPSRMWELAAMTVLGSIIGCVLLYSLGRKGGEALLRRRFTDDRVQRVRGWYQKYGMLAVIVPSLLPPPLPFKIFVLSAGAFQIPWSRFILAVGIGRSIRYFSEGIVAVLYGKQAIKLVADNFAFVGISLAALIVAGTLVYVYLRRRRYSAGLVLLPLLSILLASGCVKTVPRSQRMLPSYRFTREQALAKLETLSTAITSVQTPLSLSGSTPTLKDPNKRYSTPISLGATLHLARPNRISLVGGLPLNRLFEMVSDGMRYQVYSNKTKELFVDGLEEGPPAKPIEHLSDLVNQFVGMKPRRIHEALMLDVQSLLKDPSVTPIAYQFPVVQDQRRYLKVDFTKNASAGSPWLVVSIWFDLSTPDFDVARRQSFNLNGEIETDTRYFGYEQLGSLRYPSKFEIQLFDTGTILEIELDPKQAEFNTEIPADTFAFDPHPGAKITRFEPRESPGAATP